MNQPRSFRTLKPGEAVPSGVPQKARDNAKGYVRLRWKIAPYQYLETYEHRVTSDGFVTTAQCVHHRNGIRDDNSPSNLDATSELRHKEQHSTYDIDEAIALWRSGVTVGELARRYGVHQTSVLRRFQRRGLYGSRSGIGQLRKTHCKRGHERTAENVRVYGNHRPCRICQEMLRRERRIKAKAHA